MNQVQYNALTRFGYSGSLNDMLLKFYRSYVDGNESLPDTEHKFLSQRGFTKGTLNDRWYAYLKTFGYTGSLTEMMYKWWVAAPGSSMYQDFTSGSLDPRITFSRTTNATLTNSAGLVSYAPMNLLTYSEQFDNGVWSKVSTTVTANTAAAPDGTTTADTLSVDSSGDAYLFRTSSAGGAGTFTFSIYVKPLTATAFGLYFTQTGGPALFSLVGDGSVTSGQGTVTLLANGWYRCTITGSPIANASVGVFVPSAVAGNSWHVWGAQLELGNTATAYNPTTVKNLLGYTEHFDNAAWTKSNAFVQTNLLTYSEQFDNAVWGKTNATVTANAAIAPDGTLTGDKLVEDTTTALHFLTSSSISVTSGTAYTFSVFAKAGGKSSLQMVAGTSAFPSFYANFDLSTGDLGTSSGITSSTITPAGNGWYRCSVTVSASVTASTLVYFIISNSASAARLATYTGDGTSGIYIWGAQLVQGTSAGDYKATYAAAAAVGYTDIYGQPFAQKLVESAVTGIHDLTFSGAPVVSGTPYTSFAYLKAGERTQVALQLANFFPAGSIAYFDLSAGTVISAGAGVTASSITAIGNGWYRCSVTSVALASGSGGRFIVYPVVSGAVSYAGDGTSGIYIFGAQLSDSASVDPYVYNPVAAPSSVAYYGPRFDYDPVTLAPKGLLIEEQRTNLLTYSEQFDNAAWSKINTAISANATASPDGSVTADQVTPLGQYGGIVCTPFAAALNTVYTMGFYIKANPSAPITTRTNISFYDVTGAVIMGSARFTWSAGVPALQAVTGNATNAFVTPIGDGWYRIGFMSASSATNTSHRVYFYPDELAASGWGNLFAWGAQLEAGAFATSYIPTVASQVTRTADSASMIGNNFARWYNQTEGTLFGESQKVSATVSAINPVAMLESLAIDRQGIQYTTASQIESFAVASSLPQANFLVSATLTNPVKTAYAYKVNDFAASVNGADALTDTAGTIPDVSSLRIGNRTLISSQFLNGTIKRIAYYNRRLANSELQAITS